MRIVPLLFCFITSIFSFLNAQNCRVFTLENSGEKGRLLRTEIYENDLLVKLNNFNEVGDLSFTITHKYNDDKALTERIQTYKGQYEFDLIRQYTYDTEGRKIGELFGNNRTGKWGSYRFSYNMYNDLDTIFIYQKNGDLTHLRVFDLQYDSLNNKTVEAVRYIDLEEEESSVEKIFSYQINAKENSELTLTKDAKGELVSSEKIYFNNFEKPIKSIYKYGDSEELIVVSKYNERQNLLQMEDFENGRSVLITKYVYDEKGRRTKKIYLHENGKKNGEIYEWY